MATTIQISEKLQKELLKRKLDSRETYEDVVWDLLEDTMEVNEQTKKDIAAAIADYKAGRYVPLSEVKKKLGL